MFYELSCSRLERRFVCASVEAISHQTQGRARQEQKLRAAAAWCTIIFII